MPYYKHREVGDFNVEIKPIGKWRSKPLIKQLAPYFAGNQPKFKITIKKHLGAMDEMEFDADLLAIQPSDASDGTLSKVGYVKDVRTPFEWNIESNEMPRSDRE